MTSKEKLDYMYGVAICGSGLGETADKVREYYNKIADDLEEYEELKKIMGTPIQELMKQLKELKTVKDFVINYTAFYDTGCCLDEYIYYDSEIGTLFKKWNDE